MMPNRSFTLAVAAAVLLIAGAWVALHRSTQQSGVGGGSLFGDLGPAVGEVTEIRLSKGDGSRTTLRKDSAGWTLVERSYPADPGRVRELVLGLVNMKIVERKTSDPANYPKLGVEAPDTPTASGTLVELVAGQKTWSLIAGRNAEGRGQYVRRPKEAASALVAPSINADPDQKRWLDRQLVDVAAAAVHDIAVQPAHGPAYSLTRAKRGDAELTLSPVPRGRKAASSMLLEGQADTLVAFNFDDVHAAPATPPTAVDRATIRTFDGQVFEFTGHKSGDKGFLSVAAHRDEALAKQFAETPPPAPAAPPAPTPPAPDAAQPAAAPAGATPAAAAPAAPAASPADQAVDRLAAHGKGMVFEIPLYKYESLFKSQESLLEPKAQASGALDAAKARRKPQ